MDGTAATVSITTELSVVGVPVLVGGALPGDPCLALLLALAWGRGTGVRAVGQHFLQEEKKPRGSGTFSWLRELVGDAKAFVDTRLQEGRLASL